jgi:hypothetical protein
MIVEFMCNNAHVWYIITEIIQTLCQIMMHELILLDIYKLHVYHFQMGLSGISPDNIRSFHVTDWY